MRVETLGTSGDGDEAEFAVVTCIHGKEQCGRNAMAEILDSGVSFEQPVKYIVANEEAASAPGGGTQYIDDDLNRSFPGDRGAASHERRLAAQLLDELRGHRVLDVHSTLSGGTPFALFLSHTNRRLVRATGLDRAVDAEHRAGRGALIEFVDGVSVECGLRGTPDATETARGVILNFLAAFGIVDVDHRLSDPVVYEITDSVDHPDYEFEGENFSLVERGERFASGERTLRARDPFYPVLMSSDGYDEKLGYRAKRRGRLSTLS